MNLSELCYTLAWHVERRALLSLSGGGLVD